MGVPATAYADLFVSGLEPSMDQRQQHLAVLCLEFITDLRRRPVEIPCMTKKVRRIANRDRFAEGHPFRHVPIFLRRRIIRIFGEAAVVKLHLHTSADMQFRIA